MRPDRLITCLALAVLSSPILIAQSAVPQTGLVMAQAGCNCVEGDARKPVIAPYTAIRKTTRVQRLANGVTITHETTSKEARDSSGKTYRESQPETSLGADVQAHKVTFYNVFDPVNRITINWSSNSKEATVIHMLEPNQARIAPPAQITSPPAPETVVGSVFGTAGEAAAPSRPIRPVREDLGMKTINGVEAKGTRTTQTFPAGAVGNDLPFSVTHETWMSVDLRLVVLQIDVDPRSGDRTTELTEIERGEPDPALFQPPEGSTVRDRYPNQQN